MRRGRLRLAAALACVLLAGLDRAEPPVRTAIGWGVAPPAEPAAPAEDARTEAKVRAPAEDARAEAQVRAPSQVIASAAGRDQRSSGRTVGASERETPAPKPVLVKGATIWTMGPAGILDRGDILIADGRVKSVGGTIAPPRDAIIVDGAGRHVTPGIIDCHSHTAVDGDVNEATHNITAEVRIGDVVDWEDINIYRQLAGGVTTVNVLHGSANSIGGQNAVLRWKWGRPASGLRFPGAPEGIKFALGENPKQSNWSTDSERYPKTRMGVEESIRAAFLAAKDNRAAWEEERAAQRRKDLHRVPPRSDLQLEALDEILTGRRLVHSHAYRQDEILMLIRLAESLGFKVRTFQHVLEGYKVADEMAAHGAGGSTFSDWWAFKMETYDAIPYNAAIMARRGVLSSLNSDSSELARRLNLEAAKAVKYGGLSPVEALAQVTINPARQLGIEGRVGSLEPGKDADFVVWSGDPLSVYSIVESTWIEGVKLFDRAEDLARRESLESERAALIAKVKSPPRRDGEGDKGGAGEKPGGGEKPGEGGKPDEGGKPGRTAKGQEVQATSQRDRTSDVERSSEFSMTSEAAPTTGAAPSAGVPTTPAGEQIPVKESREEPSKAREGAEASARPVPAPITEAQVGPLYPKIEPRPVPETGPLAAFVGATVHTIAAGTIENGVVLVRGGRIAAVGAGLPVPDGAQRIDLRGRHLYPSMIDPSTSLGLVEIGSVRGSVDTTETGKINPNVRVEIAVNPASEAIPVTRASGVLLALAVPQGSLLRGTSALLRLDGWTWEEMTLRAPVGMHLSWPRVSVPTSWWEPSKSAEEIKKEKQEALKELKTTIDAARAYMKAKRAAAEGRSRRPDLDTRLEAMIPVLEGEVPMIVEANDVRQIRDAVEWAEKEKIPLVIQGGKDGWRVAELLAKKRVPVIMGAVHSLPSREDEPYDTAYTNAARLHEAGVLIAFSAGGASNVRNLPYQAAMAAAFGLPREEALKGVTLGPARILGVEERLGSIEAGKDATFFVTDGDPLEIRTQVLAAWIEGKEISLDNKHLRLYEKYRARPEPGTRAAEGL